MRGHKGKNGGTKGGTGREGKNGGTRGRTVREEKYGSIWGPYGALGEVRGTRGTG